MKRKKEYLLNGSPVDFRQLIREAQKLGYFEPDCLYTTSAAAVFLRKQGHTVEENNSTASP